MDLRQLTAAVTVAEVGSVTKAARLLHLVQPAVTRQIKLLESELGVTLFERTPQGMIVTPEGAVFVDRARRALREIDSARTEVQPDAGEVSGTVALGMLESTVELLAAPLVTRLRQKHPKVALRIVTAYSGHLQQWLDAGEIDLSLLYNLTETPSLSVTPLLDERLWALAPLGAALSADRPVSWRRALRNPMVLPVTGHGLRALIEQARSVVPVEPNVVAEVNSMTLQKLLVRAGHGWTILPAAGIAADLAAGRFSAAPLAKPEVARAVVIGHQRSIRIPRAVQVVAKELLSLGRDLVRQGEWPSARLASGLHESVRSPL